MITAVVTLTLCASAIGASGGAGVPAARPHPRPAPVPRGNPFGGRGMWIWVLGHSDSGNIAAITADARRYGISTVMIKSGDGTSIWSQFNSSTVAALHAAHLKVCAWQYVYGNHPITEAYVGAAAVHAGADCLLVDAESEYEGRYVQAQAYIGRLRDLIGTRFPVALASFPYVDYHPGFPYSVFLGPGGAQYNVPQMYWRDIGASVEAVYAHTFAFNTLYARPIYPLGQVYQHPPTGQIFRFRQLSRAYSSVGVSWWDWQESSARTWRAVAQRVGALHDFTADTAYANVGNGARGDLVVWAQQHLVAAGEPITIDGAYGPQTIAAVQAFQTAHGITPTGILGQATWQALLRYPPAPTTWVQSKGRVSALVKAQRRSMTGAPARFALVPRSATLRAKSYEIPPRLGAGRPGSAASRP